MPGIAAIGGFEEAAVVAFERAARGPGRAARGPHVRIERLRIFRIESEVGGACVVILVENFLPAIAAIGGTEDAAFGVGAVRMAEDGDEDALGSCGSMMTLVICWPSRRPRCFQLLPASVDL